MQQHCSITLLYAESREGSTELGKRKETACGVEDRGRRITPDAGILLFIQGARGAGHKLHWGKQPGIALGNKEKDKAERPHPLTGAGYRQEIKLPLLLQRKTRCERTDLSQSQTCCLGLRVDMQRGCPGHAVEKVIVSWFRREALHPRDKEGWMAFLIRAVKFILY